MKATASSIAKCCDSSADLNHVHDTESLAATDSGSFAATLTTKIAKLVKGGSKAVANKAAPVSTASAVQYNKRPLDASSRPRAAPVTSRPPDRKAATSELSQSMNVGHVNRVTHIHGVVSRRGQATGAPIQGSSLSKSVSTISLGTGSAKKQVVNKPVS